MTDTQAPPPAPSRIETSPDDLALVRDQTRRLVEGVEAMADDAFGRPSRCVGWTRAHVVAHLVGNAQALGRLVTTLEGTPTPMYESREARDAEIARLATLAPADLRERLRTSADELDDRLAGLSEAAREATAATPQAAVRGDQVVTMRLREVVLHHLDLFPDGSEPDAFTLGQVPTDLVRRLLAEQVDRLRANPRCPSMTLRTNERDVHSIGDGRPVVSAPRCAMLLWTARGDAAGIEAPPRTDLPTLPDLEASPA